MLTEISLGEVLASAFGSGAELWISTQGITRSVIEQNLEKLLEAWNGHIGAKR